MGGHGGLNILPQKRWNVYNRDNRLKVAQDEAKAKKQEDDVRERREQAEREHRHQLLLRRTTGGDDARKGITDGGEATAAPLEHINLWKAEEAKLQHPENEKQQRDELKRRGNPDFYTSDAKFDERFSFAYGLTGDKPWYAQVQKSEARASGPSAEAVAAAMRLPVGSTAQPGLPSRALTGGPVAAGPGRGQLTEDAHQQQQKEKQWLPQPETRRRGGRAKEPSSSDGYNSGQNIASTSTSSSTSGSSMDSGSSTSPSGSSSGSSSSDTSGSSRGGRRKKRRLSSRSPSGGLRNGGCSKRRRKQRRRSPSASDDDSDGVAGGKKRRHRCSEHSKSKSKSQSRNKLKSKSRRDSAQRLAYTPTPPPASKSIEQLRAERLQREREERVKERGVLASTAVLPEGPPEKAYNSAFGYAAALKRKRA